jgi:glycyl-tRNA synthetase beta chain
LHGTTVVPVKALGLSAGHTTQGHRFEAAVSPVVIANADAYADTLARVGAVIASFDARRAEIARQLAAAAEQVGGGCRPIEDDALLDEVTALVERPNVLVCTFDAEFLAVPQECLILTMKANQKYFPAAGCSRQVDQPLSGDQQHHRQKTPRAVVGRQRARGTPAPGRCQVLLRPGPARTPLEARVAGAGQGGLPQQAGHPRRAHGARARHRPRHRPAAGSRETLAQAADTAARLAKTDLLTDMVGEFPELQGIMGGYYARHDGLSEDIAFAIEDHYKPRFAGDELPRNAVGVAVALADKLETLVGMFGIGNLPSGDKDPFALRRHALGVIRMLIEKDLPLDLGTLVAGAVPAFGDRIADASPALTDFIYDRLAGSLREQGYSAQEVDAVLALRPQRLGQVGRRLAAVRAFAALPESPALAAANKRIGNILKKAGDVDAHVNPKLLQEPAEQQLFAAMQRFVPEANAQFESGDYTASLQTLAVLHSAVDAFFDDVMVNAEEMDLRLNRQGLLKSLHDAMNRVADLSRLA